VKILLLNQAFHPDLVASSLQASDLAVRLIERGHGVEVLCSRRAYDNPSQRYPRSEIWRSIRIRRIPSSGFGKAARWRRALDFGSYMCSCLAYLASLPRFDLVIGMTSPPLISFLGALFARIKGGRFVFWVMDLNPDEALAAGWLRQGSCVTSVLDTLLKYGLSQAALVVALDRYMARRIEAKGVSSDKIVVLPPWAQDHLVRYDVEGRRHFRREHCLDGKFVVMHSGNHSPCHPLTTLLGAACRLKDRTDIAFCFVGGGSEFETVRQFAKERHLQNIHTIPYQPVATLASSLSSADLHIVVMGEPFVGIVHPCKVYNIRALGIPYLYIGPADSHVSDMGPMFTANHGDVDEVVRHIETASASQVVRTTPIAIGSEYTHENLVTKMALALEATAVPGTMARPAQEALS
jgi:hypothetical protein